MDEDGGDGAGGAAGEAEDSHQKHRWETTTRSVIDYRNRKHRKGLKKHILNYIRKISSYRKGELVYYYPCLLFWP